MKIASAIVVLALMCPLTAQEPVETSFENLPAGELNSAETEVGTWSAERGHVLIDDRHHRGGSQCLHLVGGEARQVVLEPKRVVADSELVFWAERWTRREPFVFRIEARAGREWREIYRGDDEIVIGTFKTRVRVPIDGVPGPLRFTCTSPSGVLIDDLRFAPAMPMKVASVTTTQAVAPCLIGTVTNRVAQIQIEVTGSRGSLEVQEVDINLGGTTSLTDIERVELLGQSLPPSERMTFRGRHLLQEGSNVLQIGFVLATDAKIDHVFDAGCERVKFSSTESITPEITDPLGVQRGGIALRNAGDDGSKAYRIPGIITTNAGTLIAVYDIRWRGMGDLPGDIDVGMSRSTDGGRTWASMTTIMDMGDDPAFRFDGVGDPSILYDRENDTIWVAATWSHGNRSWRGSGPGLEPAETGQLMLARSDDDGRTWSDPINITKQVKKPEWCFLLQGPGRGICMQDGTLVFPAQYQDTPENDRIPRSTILYSKDRGETWKLSEGPRTNTTEAQVVEREGGELMLNMRDNRGGSRAVYTTRDLGETWTEHATSRSALREPVCNAALLRVDDRRLLFVNPDVPRAPRRHMTIKLSPDLGETWPESAQLMIDEGRSAGYPSATMIDDEWVGVLFEGSVSQLTFMRVRLADIRR